MDSRGWMPFSCLHLKANSICFQVQIGNNLLDCSSDRNLVRNRFVCKLEDYTLFGMTCLDAIVIGPMDLTTPIQSYRTITIFLIH